MNVEQQCAIWLILTNLASFATGGCIGIFITILTARKMRKEGNQEPYERAED